MNLLEQLLHLVDRERKLNVEILKKLREAEDTRLFAKHGYASMHEFCVGKLGYSDGAADRRVKAMRLIRANPQVEEKIAIGSINLTTAANLQRAFSKAAEQEIVLPRAALIEEVSGASSRSAEKTINERSSAAGVQGKKFDVSLAQKFKRIRALVSHKRPHMTEEELLHFLADEVLEKYDPVRKEARVQARRTKAPPTNSGGEATPPVKAARARQPSAALKRKIFIRDKGRCTYRCPETGRQCESTHFAQMDHVIPFALGGPTNEANLRLLCRTHNQLAAQEAGLSRPRPAPARELAH